MNGRYPYGSGRLTYRSDHLGRVGLSQPEPGGGHLVPCPALPDDPGRCTPAATKALGTCARHRNHQVSSCWGAQPHQLRHIV